MATIYKPAGRSKYIIEFSDETGKRRRKTGTTDKGVTERIARDLENRVALRREGVVDPREEAYAKHAALPLADHLAAWVESLRSRGNTTQHVKLHSSRAMRVVALYQGAKLADIEPEKPATREGVARSNAELRKWMAAARLSDLTAENVQRALSRLIGEGRSLQTANHHRNAIKSFAKWLYDTHRIREPILRGVAGYNAKEDPRHERRTVSVDELRRLIEAAQNGKPFKSMTGPMRALCYRLAVASGLRYSEIGSIRPESFDWDACPASVTVKAAYAKNGQTATLPIPDDLAVDLRVYLVDRPLGKPIFPLPHDKGAAMVQTDLEAAAIPYEDASGRFFDFHSLRCELATLADAAGVSPRVVQKMMRHSKLEMTGRYTRPRAVDLEAAASMLPSLKPEGDRPESLAMTGTDATPTLRMTTPIPVNLRRNSFGTMELIGADGTKGGSHDSHLRHSRRKLANRLYHGVRPGRQGLGPDPAPAHDYRRRFRPDLGLRLARRSQGHD